MKRLLPLIYIIILLFPVVSWADELDDTTNALNQKQSELQKAKETLETAQQRESELTGGLSPLQAALNTAVAEVEFKQAEVNATLADLDRQEKLLKHQQELRNVRVRELYKKVASDKANEIVSLLDAENLISFAKLSAYQKEVLAEEERLILNLNNEVSKIDKKRTELQKELAGLDEEKKLAQQKVDNLRYQIYLAQNQQSGANNSIASLSKQIEGLTAKQAEILAAKQAASTAIPGSETTTTLPSPGFSGDAFAFANYGVPDRVGMNQYGARGRALAGQTYQEILKAYFNADFGSTSISTINVQGYGEIPFEENYMRGISEMSRSWGALGGGKGVEALKAQAIAARTYAAKWIHDGRGAICTTQSCQVYNPNLVNDTNTSGWDYPHNQAWYKAVEDTRGIILKYGDAPIDAWFSSTAGGITQRSDMVWGGYRAWTKVTHDYAGKWPDNAFDKDSPWFFKPWGDRSGLIELGAGGRRDCNAAGKPICNPWLTKNEMIDLFNTALLYIANNNSTSGYDIRPVASGGMSHDAVRSALKDRGVEPITDFQSARSGQNINTGQTDSLNIAGTNRGFVQINGSIMRITVNLRAPGSVMLQTTAGRPAIGPMYDIITP